MASVSFSEEDFSCSVCCDIYKDPVFLTCSHSFCKGCLKQFWKTKGSRECPVCRRRSSKPDPPLNLLLKNMCETFSKGSQSQKEPFCSLHRSELKLYCEDDKQLLCLVCRDSELHKKHNFSPISEAARKCKRALMSPMNPLHQTLRRMEADEAMCVDSAQHITVQAQDTEKQIKEEFEKLHQFLRDEEAARIAALREEEEQKSQMMKKKIEKIKREISSFSDSIRSIKDEVGTDDITFLQNYRATVESARRIGQHQDSERVSGTLIDVAKHLGNLKFRVWEKMQDIVQYTPVILDPNTACTNVKLSENLTCVRNSDEWLELPANPERTDWSSTVLGSEGLRSGTHCWDVEVGDSVGWELGIKPKSTWLLQTVEFRSGAWSVCCYNEGYTAMSPPYEETPIIMERKPQRIRVQLDWDRGELSFFDADNNGHIVSFIDNFTEELFPFFLTTSSLRILPVKAAVTLEQLSLTTDISCDLSERMRGMVVTTLNLH